MRNLKRTDETTLAIDGITAVAYDFEDLVLAFGPSDAASTITLKYLPKDATNYAAAEIIATWDVNSSDTILDLHCSPDSRTISVILASGDIVVVQQDVPSDGGQIEIVGSVDVGITAIAWSPDEDLVAIATKAETLLLMTRDFDLTSDVELSVEDLKISNHVSVGWGKKETQFKGRGVAKTLRDPTMPEHVDVGRLDAQDDEKVSLSWRGDGQFLAMNSVIDSEPKRRVVRVYSREGVLESVSEPVNGLESALSWKPSGQTLAGVQRTESGLDVVLFERNGLRHGEFSLRLSPNEADTIGRNTVLHWNLDSTVLAVSLVDRVQLWTTNNYHWYLKQELRSDHANAYPNIVWHPEQPMRLVLFDRKRLAKHEYMSLVARGPVKPPNDQGLVVVIDGKSLKITPLRMFNVPPPMAHTELELSHCANDVVIQQRETATTIHVLQSNGISSVWELSQDGKYATGTQRPADRTCDDGHDLEGDTSLGKNIAPAEILPHGLGKASLSPNGLLQVVGGVNTRIAGVTSYIVTDLHLIFTTSNHLLKFVHLQRGEELQIPRDEPETDERCRSVERGARIITVMPSAYSLVLQMPRGNLETIYPRALVLAGIRQAITGQQYKKAFSICRAHRVDMNIVHDYSPEQFMAEIPLFLKQIKKPEHIDLFLSSLSEENVAQTIYRETLAANDPIHTNAFTQRESNDGESSSPSKVNKICDAFLKELRLKATPSLQNIITAHVCKSPPDLEAGLNMVSDLRKTERPSELESTVEHICFLADVNQLYDTALGLYDLDVTLLVAQQTQKDPREYLPYLQGLNNMPVLERNLTIDNDLRRYDKALSHLHALDDFERLKDHVVKHDLYTSAIELFRYDTAKLIDIMRLHANYLSSRNRYQDAGIAYDYVQDYTLAFEAYRAAGSWRECLSAAALVPVPEAELSNLATDLASSLEEAKDFKAAASVQIEYLQDLPTSMRLLCRGFHFSEATRLAALHHKPDLLPTVLDPGLAEASASMTEMLAEMRSQLKAQIPRLHELRQKKLADPMAFLDGADGGDDDIPDNISLAPTNASTTGTFMTRYTNQSTGTLATNVTHKTSKNRRREERKRARGKKGTVYEEEYLVNSVERLVQRLNQSSADVSRLVDGLLRRAMRERAVAVDRAMEDVMKLCRDSMKDVFVPGALQGGDGEQEGISDGRPGGGQGVLWEAMASSHYGRQAPTLKVFERSSLLVT
ncbi:hypothetical protein LTR62_007404 [Meristemomyces frigidus]|uniref:Elongator complex protein 1 n=1 Tax=Meristemomyces frigidus TaxID=1508187 RepID=A0AAN7YJ68_9PEZI|nr:hypothetical protein LTR62_007404 [Meristemomyces frigidus]